VLGKVIWVVLLPVCASVVGCHESPAPPPTAPKAAEPAVVVVEDADEPDEDEPAAATENAPLETGPIKVGIAHSLSGTMAVVGARLEQMALMTLAQINAEGGVLGRPLEPVVVDPASDWPLFAEKARELLAQQEVAVIFGGETSVSRKSMLPVIEELGGLLFYPATFEGQELSCNVFYTGMTPSQQAIPALDYLMSREGGGYRRFVFVGTDYVLPRTTFRLLAEDARQHGIGTQQTMEMYTPFGHTDYGTIVSEIAKFGNGTKTAIVASFWGESLAAFHAELARQKLQTRVLHLSLDEYQIQYDTVRPYVGTLSARSYLSNPAVSENARLQQDWREYVSRVPPGTLQDARIEDSMEATYVGIRLWKLAVERAGSTAPERVRATLPLVKLKGPMGVELGFDKNHFLARPLFIASLRSDGSYDVRWRSAGALPPEPFSRYHPETYQRPARTLQELERCRTQ